MTDFLEDRKSGQGGQAVLGFLFYLFLDEQVYRKHVDGKLLSFDNVMISSSVSVISHVQRNESTRSAEKQRSV